MVEPIKIWQFYDAPKKYSKYFDNDDADWLAVLPKEFKNDYITWLDEPYFGCCCVQDHVLENGTLLKVGYHA